jgi:hypothetical protein
MSRRDATGFTITMPELPAPLRQLLNRMIFGRKVELYPFDPATRPGR